MEDVSERLSKGTTSIEAAISETLDLFVSLQNEVLDRATIGLQQHIGNARENGQDNVLAYGMGLILGWNEPHTPHPYQIEVE